jgi:hypothetical protein
MDHAFLEVLHHNTPVLRANLSDISSRISDSITRGLRAANFEATARDVRLAISRDTQASLKRLSDRLHNVIEEKLNQFRRAEPPPAPPASRAASVSFTRSRAVSLSTNALPNARAFSRHQTLSTDSGRLLSPSASPPSPRSPLAQPIPRMLIHPGKIFLSGDCVAIVFFENYLTGNVAVQLCVEHYSAAFEQDVTNGANQVGLIRRPCPRFIGSRVCIVYMLLFLRIFYLSL